MFDLVGLLRGSSTLGELSKGIAKPSHVETGESVPAVN